MLHLGALFFLTALATPYALGNAVQVPLDASNLVSTQPAPNGRVVITPDVSALAERLLKKHHVPGLSVGVVRLTEDAVLTEIGTWGNKTEDGDAVQPDVRILSMFNRGLDTNHSVCRLCSALARAPKHFSQPQSGF